mgnify:FL=1
MKMLFHKQYGLSLVEILVALVISLFLLGGIIQVYTGNKTAYRFTDASSRIQENGRFALDTITTDIRMAGFWGCLPFQQDVNNDGILTDENKTIQNHLDTASASYKVELHDFINNPPITATVNDGLNDSDSLTLRGAKAGSTPLTADLSTPGDDVISVQANSTFNTNDIILITNCYAADIFEATAVSADGTTITHSPGGTATTPGNANINGCGGGTHCLIAKDVANITKYNNKPYETKNSAAFTLQAVTYSIKPSASGGDNPEPALWRSVNDNDQELIEGVEQMQVLFGEDTDTPPDGYPNQYRTSDLVGNLNNVTAIRIWLVVRSDKVGILDSSQTYTINSVNENKGDTRLRHVFSSTIALRNRIR